MSPKPDEAAAGVGGRNFDMTALVTRSDGDEGVIWATGTENSGISVFVQDDRLVVDYNAFVDHTVVESSIPVPIGDAELGVRIRRTGSSTGTVEVLVDGTPCGSGDLPLFMRMISSVGASIGYDHGSTVSPRYDGPFRFSGSLHEVTIQLLTREQADALTARSASEMSRQ